MQPILVSDGVALHPAAAASLDDFWRLLNHPDVRRYLCDDRMMPRDEVAGLLDGAIEQGKQGLGLWVIRTGGAAIGYAGLRPVMNEAATIAPELADMIEPVIALDPAHWRRGHATQAMSALLRHAFGTLGFPVLAALVDVPNEASHRLMRRLGFTSLGVMAGPRYAIRQYRLPAHDFTAWRSSAEPER